MNNYPESRTSQKMESARAALDPSSLRAHLLGFAKKYKSSWVELGEALKTVIHEVAYKNWGYEQFETYCAQELHIRKETAYKMIANYNFLEKNEPRFLKENDVPDLATVSLLHDVKRREDISEGVYQQMRAEAFKKSASPARLKKILSDAEKKDSSETTDKSAIMIRAAGQLKKLKTVFTEMKDVPETIFSNLDNIIQFTSKFEPPQEELKVRPIYFLE